MRWRYAIALTLFAAMGLFIFRTVEAINSFGRGAYEAEPPYSRAVDAQVQRACIMANSDPGRKAAGIHMDAMQIDGRDYYCRPASQRQ